MSPVDEYNADKFSFKTYASIQYFAVYPPARQSPQLLL